MITSHRRNRFAHGPFGPTPEQDDFITYWRPELEKLSTGQILYWVAEMFPSKSALVTSCGLGGSVLISMIGQLELGISILNPGTGKPLGETRRQHERLTEMFGVQMEYGNPNVFLNEASLCCGEKRYRTLRRTAGRFDLWISEAVRARRPDERRRPVLDWDDRFGLFRVSPLIRWTGQSVRNKASRESIPFDEHSDQDYFNDDCYECLVARPSDPIHKTTINGNCHCCCPQ